jgi:[acyl-carrier-protein] S-malonyltransferase
MGKDLYEESAKARRLFELAGDATGVDCRKLLFESNEDELRATNVSQLAIALVNKAAALALSDRGVVSAGCAGFSLGEYSALNDAGVIGDGDLFRIVQTRGRIMERVSRTSDGPAGPAGMAAVVGLEIQDVRRILEEMQGREPALRAYAALHNAPTQTVLSGTAEALARAEGILVQAGAMKYVVLKTSGPFHSPLMEEARQELAGALAVHTFRDPVKALYSNVTGRRISSGEEARRLCADQLVSTVLWVDVEASVLADGYDAYLEVGPGNVLAGLWRRYQRGQRCSTAGTVAQICAIKEGETNAG